MAYSTPLKALQRAVVILRTQQRLAFKIGVSQSVVSLWIKDGKCPAEQAIAISNATNNLVTRSELRPDIYPPEDEKEAKKHG